jgi:hypothetical protein
MLMRLAMLAIVLVLATCGRPGPLVDYQRSGGIAGADDHPDELKALQALLADDDFAALSGNYLPDNSADLFEYRLTANGRTIRTRDTAVPEAARPVLDWLNALIGVHG